jgi:WbqC-like protein family
MKVAIMQPYFLPYIGYFQLINAVDVVIYDNIQFSKKGWFHRNRLLVNGNADYFTLPLKKDSDYLNVNQRYLGDNWDEEKSKILRKIKECYRKAPNFESTYKLVESVFENSEKNLFEFLYNSVLTVNSYLGIDTKIIKSSVINIDHELKSQDKVLAICNKLEAKQYINPIGGLELYDNNSFTNLNIDLSFLQSNSIEYQQLGQAFIPWLSIVDVLMFNDLAKIKSWLSDFKLQKNSI